MTAKKDAKANEIVVMDAAGTEVKRLPDGFGMDVPSVMKLLQAILGVNEKKEEGLPGANPEEQKMEAPKPEVAAPEMKEELPASTETMMAASQKAKLTKQAEDLNKKEAELKAKEAEINS